MWNNRFVFSLASLFRRKGKALAQGLLSVMSWWTCSCRCDRYIFRLASIITYSGSCSSLGLVIGPFLHLSGLTTSSCTYIIHPFFSEKSQWIKIFLLGDYVCSCSWKEVKTTYEIIWGCVLTSVDLRQGYQLPYLSFMNVISLLVFYVLEMLYLSCKSFWPVLWCLFWEWEMKVLWCLHPSTAEEFSSSIMAEVSLILFLSHLPSMRSCTGWVLFWSCLIFGYAS